MTKRLRLSQEINQYALYPKLKCIEISSFEENLLISPGTSISESTVQNYGDLYGSVWSKSGVLQNEFHWILYRPGLSLISVWHHGNGTVI